jgi:hypothetical protein
MGSNSCVYEIMYALIRIYTCSCNTGATGWSATSGYQQRVVINFQQNWFLRGHLRSRKLRAAAVLGRACCEFKVHDTACVK